MKENYEIIKKKDGFYVRWIVNPLLEQTFLKNNYNIKEICCHMRIWTKIFYTKHQTATWNNNFKEDKVLKNLQIKINDSINKNGIAKTKNSNTRIEINETINIANKIIIYKWVLEIRKDKAYIITMHRRS